MQKGNRLLVRYKYPWILLLVLLVNSCQPSMNDIHDNLYLDVAKAYLFETPNTAILNSYQGVFSHASEGEYIFLIYSGFPFARFSKNEIAPNQFSNLSELGDGLFAYSGNFSKKIFPNSFDTSSLSEFFHRDEQDSSNFQIDWVKLEQKLSVNKLVAFSPVLYSSDYSHVYCGIQIYENDKMQVRVVSFTGENLETIEQEFILNAEVINYAVTILGDEVQFFEPNGIIIQ